MKARIWRVTFDGNFSSRDVIARDIYSAIRRARRFSIGEARKENRLTDARYYIHAPVTEVELIAESDDNIPVKESKRE